MARPIRVEFTDAVYHVTARGNERKAIYRDDQDRQRFLETVAEAHDRFGVVIDGYCLMSNHYHLLIQTPRANVRPRDKRKPIPIARKGELDAYPWSSHIGLTLDG